MGNSIDTVTNSDSNLSKNIILSEISSSLRFSQPKSNMMLIGAWASASIISLSLSTNTLNIVPPQVSYSSNSYQSELNYEPRIDLSYLDEELSSNVFVRTKPTSSFEIKLNITKISIGKPNIE